MTITGKCAHCGAQIAFSDNAEAVICEYCTSINAIQEVAASNIARSQELSGNTSVKTEVETSAKQPIKTLREVIPDYQWRATYADKEGFLYLTKQEVGVKPNKIFHWFGDMSKFYMRIEDIKGYTLEQGIFGPLDQCIVIYGKKRDIKLHTLSNNVGLLRLIECRRKAYFISRGLDVPSLSIGESNHYVADITGLDEKQLPVPKNVSAGKMYFYALLIFIPIWVLIETCS